MPDQTPSAVYHLDFAGQIPKGRILHVNDQPGSRADIYFHPLHAREPLVWELNCLTLHQVGFGYWQQRWTHPGRMQEGLEGLSLAVSQWKIVPASRMPGGRYVFPVEHKGACIWLIRSGYCTAALRDAMNDMLLRIAGDGLWEQSWNEEQEPPIGGPWIPLLAPPRVPASV